MAGQTKEQDEVTDTATSLSASKTVSVLAEENLVFTRKGGRGEPLINMAT